MFPALHRLLRQLSAQPDSADGLTRFDQVDSDGLVQAGCKGSVAMRVGDELAADFADTRPSFAKAVERRRSPRS